MNQTNDFTCQIEAPVTTREAMSAIQNIQGWWAKDFQGNTSKADDTFKVHFGTTMVEFLVEKQEQDSMMEWLVRDCFLPWLENKTEWTGTRLIWTLAQEGTHCKITFVHRGLVPEIECYEACNTGWHRHIDGSLMPLLTTGIGLPS